MNFRNEKNLHRIDQAKEQLQNVQDQIPNHLISIENQELSHGHNERVLKPKRRHSNKRQITTELQLTHLLFRNKAIVPTPELGVVPEDKFT